MFREKLCAAAVMAVLAAACAHHDNVTPSGGMPFSNEKQVKVGIALTGGKPAPSVDPETITLKKNMEHAVWTSENPIRITFDDGYVPPCKSTGNAGYRCVSKTFAVEKRYKYSVAIQVNGSWTDPLDPFVDVIPGP